MSFLSSLSGRPTMSEIGDLGDSGVRGDLPASQLPSRPGERGDLPPGLGLAWPGMGRLGVVPSSLWAQVQLCNRI